MDYVKIDSHLVNKQMDMVRTGWLAPYYTLTDGVNVYGELSYSGLLRRTGHIKIAKNSWTIDYGRLFSNEILIKDELTGASIASLKTRPFRGTVILQFADGQTFSFRRNGIFMPAYFWQSEQLDRLMTIKYSMLNFKRPFTIETKQNTLKNSGYMELMLFTGVYMILLRAAQAANGYHG